MNGIRILFVDDEDHILSALKRNLIKESFEQRFAQSADEALDILAKEAVHIIVSDMKMPKMDGLTLLRKVKEQYPEVVRLVLSGFTHIAQIIPCINTGEVYRYITKPINPSEFKKTLYDAIDYYLMHREKEDLIESLKVRNMELQDALNHIKVLQGILPVCAYCRKVRDDHNYWQEVEKYIVSHSDTRLVNSICPQCLAECIHKVDETK